MMGDVLTLKLPAKPEYVLPVRLFISGVATRAGFDVDKIEDIKTAISEAGVLLLKNVCKGDLVIEATVEKDVRLLLHMEVNNVAAGCDAGEPGAEEFSKMIIEAMCENTDMKEVDGIISEVDMVFELRG